MKNVVLNQPVPQNIETLESALARLGTCDYWLGIEFPNNNLKGLVVEIGCDKYLLSTGATNGNGWGKFSKAELGERLERAFQTKCEVKSFTDQKEFAAWLAS